MSLTLILTRHAKSAPQIPPQRDHDRPLSPRGLDEATRIGRWLAGTGTVPDTALVSSALRTRETCAALASELPRAPRVVYLDRLYHAGPEMMLRCLQAADGEAVIMVGHNPGIAAFAGGLPAARPAHPRFDDYPTGATLVLGFDVADWAEVLPGTGRVIAFVTPKDLG